ncbi:MAG: SDR family oxidoreductase [Candidatus Omnitrophota bacterium]|jgi:UDP-glucose 4-epimerase|nr:MAG: SDR family oxidoreductase [Candidatus Omnitrophota bacterium]
MARFVVTGGAGFIGSHLVEHLLSENHEVCVIDNFSTGLRANIQPFLNRIALHEIDLRDADAVKWAMDGAEYVLHQAALPSVPRSVRNPRESHDVNATGTLNVLVAAKDAGVKRLIYASSSSTYGNTNELYKHEGLISQPISPYGVAKTCGEFYCKAFYESYGLETVSLRYFNVFGPRQNPDSPYTGVMAIFIPLMLKDQPPTIYGDGSATRDFTFIKNNVHANLLAVSAEKAAGETMNIACGESYSVLDVVQTINRILGKSIEPIFAPPRAGDIKHSCAFIEKAGMILNYKPLVSFEEGMAETIAWYRQKPGL